MKSRIPFSLLPTRTLSAISKYFINIAEHVSQLFPFLEVDIMQSELETNKRDYLAMCLAATTIFFLVFSILAAIIIYPYANPLIGVAIILGISFFIFFQQLFYPRMLALKRVRDIDRNILPALRTILIQVNSGIPTFNVIVGISNEDYGEISKEFKKIVNQINAGKSEVSALEESATKNPSLFYRRAIWQIVNGMKSGSSIDNVLKEAINALSQEQIIEIENYGSRLSPLAMFYMLIVIILPSLSITMMIILASFLNIDDIGIKLMFWGLLLVVLFFQIMFIGMLRTRRPNLLGES